MSGYLASISSVDHRHSLIPSQGVNINLVRVSTAMTLLLRLRELRQQQLLALLQRDRCENLKLTDQQEKGRYAGKHH